MESEELEQRMTTARPGDHLFSQYERTQRTMGVRLDKNNAVELMQRFGGGVYFNKAGEVQSCSLNGYTVELGAWFGPEGRLSNNLDDWRKL